MPKVKVDNLPLDRIRAWIENPDTEELSEVDKRILERIDFAYNLLKIEPPHKVIKNIVNRYKVSYDTACRDVEFTNKLWNPRLRITSEWLEQFIINDALSQMKACKQMLDMSTWQKTRADLIKVYTAMIGRQAPIDPQLLGHNNYFLAINFGGQVEKIDANKLNQLPAGKREELAEMLFPDIEDIEVESVMNS